MFSKEEIKLFNIPYFEIASEIEDRKADTLIVIKSKNTGHYWRLHKKKNIPKGKRTIVIYHKHEAKDEYHRHYETFNTLQAIKSIIEHDTYVLRPDTFEKKPSTHSHGIIYS